MPPKRVLVTGASGMLGTDVVKALFELDCILYGTGRTRTQGSHAQTTGDLLDDGFLELLVRTVKPDVIVHCAAFTDLKYCEAEPEMA